MKEEEEEEIFNGRAMLSNEISVWQGLHMVSHITPLALANFCTYHRRNATPVS